MLLLIIINKKVNGIDFLQFLHLIGDFIEVGSTQYMQKNYIFSERVATLPEGGLG